MSSSDRGGRKDSVSKYLRAGAEACQRTRLDPRAAVHNPTFVDKVREPGAATAQDSPGRPAQAWKLTTRKPAGAAGQMRADSAATTCCAHAGCSHRRGQAGPGREPHLLLVGCHTCRRHSSHRRQWHGLQPGLALQANAGRHSRQGAEGRRQKHEAEEDWHVAAKRRTDGLEKRNAAAKVKGPATNASGLAGHAPA